MEIQVGVGGYVGHGQNKVIGKILPERMILKLVFKEEKYKSSDQPEVNMSGRWQSLCEASVAEEQ